jgi:hypothetical protein
MHRFLRPSLIMLVLMSAPVFGAEGFDLGVRADALVGDGNPANDVPTASLFGRRHLNDRWGVEVIASHSPKFDVERTPEFLGITQDPALEVIDSKGTSTTFQIYLERWYGRPGRRLEWYWGVGAGLASVDVEDVSGRSAGGRPFTIQVEAGTEPIVGATAGLRFRLGERWGLETSFRAEQHYADWEVREVATGATASVKDYLLTGLHLGLGYRF